ncbi:phage tail protein [Aureimonas psammosilenae]|uniref:phage tail protein n=1 Tax=Aureimonas psammosilenae TaxID=2495496 RepID=UPI00126069D1|nr:phage tail protein [Aureimonas psammosilenae]
MTLPTFNPPLAPSVGGSDTPEVKLLTVQFGGGYTQTTGDGINHIRKVRELTWEALYPEEHAEIIAFLEERAGYKTFYFQLQHDAKPVKWTCEKWSSTTVSGDYFRLNATFRQSFTMEA